METSDKPLDPSGFRFQVPIWKQLETWKRRPTAADIACFQLFPETGLET
jgi:hypothetical protein